MHLARACALLYSGDHQQGNSYQIKPSPGMSLHFWRNATREAPTTNTAALPKSKPSKPS